MPGPGLGPLSNFGAGSGSGVAPVIVSVVDDGNADSATVSITGDGAIQLYYRIGGAETWTTGLTRTGSGDIVQTGLTTPNWYEFYATADQGTGVSQPSNIKTSYIAGTSQISIEAAIVSILLGDGNVTDLVGDRVYPVYVPQGAAMPAITYQLISAPSVHSFDGPAGLVDARYQLNCWAETYSEAQELSDAVRLAMDGYVGSIGGRVIQNIESNDAIDLPVIKAGTDVLRRMNRSRDFNIWYEEDTA